MSIRSETMPYTGQLSFQLQDLLRRNGMRAQVAVDGDKLMLLVQGHDSPMLSYSISEKQFRALTDGGTNFSNKKAYATFNSIVGRDFDLPSSYVAARNVNSRVVMGLHGVRESRPHGMGMPVQPHAFGHGFLGWTPRNQPGFHMRNIHGAPMMAAPMLMEHTDGRMRPGELKSGGYGYYYKGGELPQNKVVDPIKDMQSYFPPVVTRSRPTETATPYNELITSDVYFSNEKWQECLSSHGIAIDAQNKTLTIQSKATQQDFIYDITDEEVQKLTSNSIKEVPVNERIDLLNSIVSLDFKDKVTMEMLNSKENISIGLHPEVERSFAQQQSDLLQITTDSQLQHQHVAPSLNPENGYVDGSKIEQYDERKGWYREGSHGREVEVGDIWVEKVAKQLSEEEKSRNNSRKNGSKDKAETKENVTYRMSAVINGEVISHEISKKQYDKFMSVDDYQRQRMMSKVFSEVDLRTRPEMRRSFNPLAAIAAGLSVASEATFLGADIAHNIEHIKHPHGAPTVYGEAHGSGRIYVKPGVDSPQDIASRAFEAGVNHATHGHGMGR